MNKLEKFSFLKNTYYVLRHGESLANVEGIVVSKPENGVPKYGLSEVGKTQVKQSILKALESQIFDENVRIVSSDFKRANESANIAHGLLSCRQPLMLDARLRERDFGDFELKNNKYYNVVWDNDAIDSSHTKDNAESADAVMRRATALVEELESQYEGETILLVAHGDTLQILQAAFLKLPASKQREMKHLETAEIRFLSLV